MTYEPATLIMRPDPDRVMRVADRFIVRAQWPASCAELGRFAGFACANAEASAAELISLADRAEDTGRWRIAYQSADGSAIVTIGVDRKLTTDFCVRRFGGNASSSPRGAGGEVERSLAKRIADAIVADLSKTGTSWVPVASAGTPAGDDVAVRQTVTYPIAKAATTDIELILTGPVLTQPANRVEPAVWNDMLLQAVRSVRVPIRTILARPVISAGEVARLRPGDVIPIRAPHRVELLAGNHRLASGTLTELDGHAAIRIEPTELSE